MREAPLYVLTKGRRCLTGRNTLLLSFPGQLNLSDMSFIIAWMLDKHICFLFIKSLAVVVRFEYSPRGDKLMKQVEIPKRVGMGSHIHT